VPFLLITAVFTRSAILELNLPAADNAEAEQPPPRPQIAIYPDRLAFSDGRSEARNLPWTGSVERELKPLQQWLIDYQARHPQTQEALLLVAGEVDYESLIKVMDVIRSQAVRRPDGSIEYQPLFPDISLGDAPESGDSSS